MTAIRGYIEYDEALRIYAKEKREALQRIAEHGTNIRVRLAASRREWLLIAVPAGIGAAAIAIADIRSVIAMSRSRKKKPSQPTAA